MKQREIKQGENKDDLLLMVKRLSLWLSYWGSNNDEHIVQMEAWKEMLIEQELVELSASIEQMIFHMKSTKLHLLLAEENLNNSV
ncbi:hypothetical protein [Photobacterium chitinilyticum]|uniref:Uncharacterized protein n=1 Tax=Photobacterium chitinilyticum TaxID=2485123 RepID=A0A444JNB1_9GAMM|nr:hypothetical protein [Photobacterium chitinilyticum]RWX54574.1 hypothetical protein EDI28_15885 [Photobacterium chitinilyticum]